MTKEEAFQSVLLRCKPLEYVDRERIFPDNKDKLFTVLMKEVKSQTIAVTGEEFEALQLFDAYELGAIRAVIIERHQFTRVTIGFHLEMLC